MNPGERRRGDIVDAIKDPLRLRMLHLLNEEVLNVAELAKRLGIPALEASYHLNMLVGMRSVEPVDDAPEFERRYRAMARAELDNEAWSRLTVEERNEISRTILDATLGHAYEAVAQGTLNGRDDNMLSVIDVNLDNRAWSELNVLLVEMLDRITELEAQSAARAASGTANDIRTRVVLMQYEGARAASEQAAEAPAPGRQQPTETP